MSPADPPRPASLTVAVTDAVGRPFRKPALVAWLRGVAPARARGHVNVALVSDAVMRRLNRRHAHVDRPTDVLSFVPDAADPAPPPPRAPAARRDRHLGDIAIALGVAGRQARAAGHPLDTELRILALHGLLHLLGYDHARDDGTMASLERRLRRRGGLTEGLIDRAGGAGTAGRAGGDQAATADSLTGRRRQHR